VSFLLHFPRRKIFGITSVDSLNKFVIITVNMNQMRRVIQFVKRKLFSYSVSQDKDEKKNNDGKRILSQTTNFRQSAQHQ
jgi:hypothetical protein